MKRYTGFFCVSVMSAFALFAPTTWIHNIGALFGAW